MENWSFRQKCLGTALQKIKVHTKSPLFFCGLEERHAKNWESMNLNKILVLKNIIILFAFHLEALFEPDTLIYIRAEMRINTHAWTKWNE